MDVFAKLLRDWHTGRALALLILLYIPVSAWALGVGTITVESALDEPLKAQIDLLGVKPDDLESLSVSVAPNDVFDRMGIERIDVIDMLRFRVAENDDGKHVINVTSEGPIREPFMNFLIEVNWANGRLLREFTVLLDPPVFDESAEAAAPVEAPESGAPESISLSTPEKPAAVQAPAAAAPSARQGAFDQMQALKHGPVERGEVLWHIAEGMRPEGVTLEQMMLALLRENPNAFFGNNVSMLKEGAVLRIDNQDALTSISVQEAIQEIARQHGEWIAYKRQRSAERAVAAESAGRLPSGQTGAQSNTDVTTGDAQLKLVAPSEQEMEMASTQASTAQLRQDLEKITNEFALASEAMEVAGKENDELQQRLKMLEGQMQSMQRLLKLKDQQLSLLQEQVEDAGMDPVVDATAQIEEEAAAGDSASMAADDGMESTLPDAEETDTEAADWTSDPFTLATLVGMILLISILGWVMYRNQQRNKSFARERALDEAMGEPEDTSLGEVRIIKPDSRAEAEPEQAAEAAEPEQVAAETTGDTSNIPSQAEVAAPRTDGSLDPISEADVYLAYEKYDKAEELLKSAIQADPDRHELKLKLLETYFSRGDTEAFEVYAEELYAALGGDESGIWQKALDMGHELVPANPLFGGIVDDSDTSPMTSMPSELTDTTIPVSEPVSTPQDSSTLSLTDAVDVDKATGDEGVVSSADSAIEATSAEPVTGESAIEESISDVSSSVVEEQTWAPTQVTEVSSAEVQSSIEVSELEAGSELTLAEESEPLPEAASEPLDASGETLSLAVESEPEPEPLSEPVSGLDTTLDLMPASDAAVEETSLTTTDNAADENQPSSQTVFVDSGVYQESDSEGPEVLEVLSSEHTSAVDALTGLDTDIEQQTDTAESIHLEAELPDEAELGVSDESTTSAQTVFVDSTITVGHEEDESEIEARAAIAEQFAIQEAERIAQSGMDQSGIDHSEISQSGVEQESSVTTSIQTEPVETAMLENALDGLQAESQNESQTSASDIDLDSMPSSELVRDLAEAEESETAESEPAGSFVAQTTSLPDTELNLTEQMENESELEVPSELQAALTDQTSIEMDSDIETISADTETTIAVDDLETEPALDSAPASELANELANELADEPASEVTATAPVTEPAQVSDTSLLEEAASELIPESLSVTTEPVTTGLAEGTSEILEDDSIIVSETELNAPVSELDTGMAAAESGHDYAESSFFLLADEVGTKLDLAKAYMEMGDKDGARDLLAEVLEEGNDMQKKEARILLNTD